jgi:hypothetical protein
MGEKKCLSPLSGNEDHGVLEGQRPPEPFDHIPRTGETLADPRRLVDWILMVSRAVTRYTAPSYSILNGSA